MFFTLYICINVCVNWLNEKNIFFLFPKKKFINKPMYPAAKN